MSEASAETVFDVAIVCAVDTEIAKVLETPSKDAWKPLAHARHDPTTYHAAVYRTLKGKELRVVAACATQMGMPAAAVLATKMIVRFEPQLVVMVGIAAGAKKGGQKHGDILAPDQTFDYNAGKVSRKDKQLHFAPDAKPLSLSEIMIGRLKDWARTRRHLNEISDGWPIPGQQTRIEVHVGPLGSGAQVIDTAEPVEKVVEHWRKLVGIEMEAYAVHVACHKALHPAREFLCLKSISDFVDGDKDSARDYAAFTAAQFCYRFLVEEWETLFPNPP